MLIQVLEHTLQVRESSASKRVSHSKILFQPEVDLSYSFFVVVIFYLLELGEFFLFLGVLDAWFLEGVSEDRASGCHMSTFSTVKAESLLGALLSFPGDEFLWKFDCVNVHSVGVFRGSRGG